MNAYLCDQCGKVDKNGHDWLTVERADGSSVTNRWGSDAWVLCSQECLHARCERQLESDAETRRLNLMSPEEYEQYLKDKYPTYAHGAA